MTGQDLRDTKWFMGEERPDSVGRKPTLAWARASIFVPSFTLAGPPPPRRLLSGSHGFFKIAFCRRVKEAEVASPKPFQIFFVQKKYGCHKCHLADTQVRGYVLSVGMRVAHTLKEGELCAACTRAGASRRSEGGREARRTDRQRPTVRYHGESDTVGPHIRPMIELLDRVECA